MDAELVELLQKLHTYHVTNLNLLSRLAARKAVLGTKEGDRLADFITRELEQVDLISKAMTRSVPAFNFARSEDHRWIA